MARPSSLERWRRGSQRARPEAPRSEAQGEAAGMLAIGVFHNGASSLPVITTKEGVTLNDGSLAEVHRVAQETLVNQVRQGILAEKLGYQSFWLTEHHFQPEGAEMSPNPLMVQMSVAAHTKRIRLGQAANIIVWHHPVRLAEQIATLDVISGGPGPCGIRRGHQPPPNETPRPPHRPRNPRPATQPPH